MKAVSYYLCATAVLGSVLISAVAMAENGADRRCENFIKDERIDCLIALEPVIKECLMANSPIRCAIAVGAIPKGCGPAVRTFIELCVEDDGGTGGVSA